MQKLIIKNKYQSPNRVNILAAAGIAQINEPIFPQNGERIFGGLGKVTFNQASQYNEDDSPNDPINPPDCPNCGGGIEPEPSVPPGANCDKKNISELKQVLDDYANQSFCDKEFPDVQFSTFIGYDKPPSDSTSKEIELRMLCPVDECEFSQYDDTIRYQWTIRAQHVCYGGLSCYSCGNSTTSCFNGGVPEIPYEDEVFIDTLKGAMQRFFSIQPSSLLQGYIANVLAYRNKNGYCSNYFPNNDITIEDTGILNVRSDSSGKIYVANSFDVCYKFNGYASDRFGFDCLTRIDFFLEVGNIVYG